MINLSKAEAKAMQYFMANPGKEICAGDLKRFGFTHSTAYKVIKSLNSKKLIKKGKKIWKTQFYMLNESNIVKIAEIDVSEMIDDDIFHAIQVIRSVLIKSKNPIVNRISFRDMLNILLLIAIQSNIREDDARIKAVVDYIKGNRVYIDDKKMENMGKRILRAIYYN